MVGKRFYSAEGLLLRRHFHDDVSGTWTNPVSGATASFSGGSMTLHDLAEAGWVESRWEDGDPRRLGRPRRRYYRITPQGLELTVAGVLEGHPAFKPPSR